MITVECCHHFTHFRQTDERVFEANLAALSHLNNLLCRGGKILPFTDSKIRVELVCEEGRQSVHSFRGRAKDISMLHDFLYFRNQYNGTAYVTDKDSGEKVLEDSRMMDVDPYIEDMLVDGPYKGTVAALIVCGVKDPRQIGALAHLDTGDIIAAIELSKTGDCSSIAEALAA